MSSISRSENQPFFIFVLLLLVLRLTLLLLAIAIILCSFLVYFSNHQIIIPTPSSMLASPLPPVFFFSNYSLFTSSHGDKASCIVISVLTFVHFFHLGSSFVHLKNDPEYLTMGTAQVFIPLRRFL